MSDTPWFPKRWMPEDPTRIQLYSLATPNGQKVSITLEELGLAYDAHLIDIFANDQFDEDYLKLSPNGKIPTLSDPDGPGGRQLSSMESGAILLYLAEKTGELIPKDALERHECLQWLFFQMGHIGPMFGQFGHFFKYAKETCEHPYPVERYSNEARRLLGVLDKRLGEGSYLVAEMYTIADIAIWPWVSCLDVYYKGREKLAMDDFENVAAWFERIGSREAVQRGMKVCMPEWLKG